MSASLVGSEMCIRDSKGSDHSLLCQLPSLQAYGSHTGRTLAQTGMLWDPVSYTHLTLPTICSV
eukprot:9617390-Alexandrium_andersonii.AAC.1